MGNAHEYLSCALPEETEGNAQETDYDMFAKLLSAYCEEDASEWLPVLDRNAKKSASELRRFGRKKVSQGKIGLEEFEEVDDTDLFHASVALYVTGPALSGDVWGD